MTPALQINRNTSLGYHLDPRDVKEHWTVMTVLKHGSFEGGP